MRTFSSGRLILCLLSLWLCCTAVSVASLDTLKGEINIYTPVLAIDYCHSAIVVQSSKGLYESMYGWSSGVTMPV